MTDELKKIVAQLIAGTCVAAIFATMLPAIGSQYHLPSVVAGIFIFATVHLAGKFYE